MPPSRLLLNECRAGFGERLVPYSVLLPPGYDAGEPGAFPLCLFLHGASGDRDNLSQLQPLFEEDWTSGRLPPMVIACASTGGMSYYLDHPDGSELWETFVAETFPAHLRSELRVGAGARSTAIAGISMGGYGSLKIAFRRPCSFAAVAALQPMIEPALRSSDSGPRNRFYGRAGGPPALVSPQRDAALFEGNNPANLALENADEILESGLAVYIEVGDADVLNAHDGAEFLHRRLWDLDLSHEYHLVRGADHLGPSLLPRVREAFGWLGRILAPKPLAPVDAALEGARRELHAQLEPLRAAASEHDAAMKRRFGALAEPDS